ncbi:MAG: carboxysome shell carbonic anhydrase [Rhodocyclaceae bacterium]|nr:carboxysome shell carbonic anhydrase [Rhodocyclaceae bacterium]
MVDTRKRRAALMAAANPRPAMRVAPGLSSGAQPNPACVVDSGQRCEHALVDRELNRRLAEYEMRVRARFAAIEPTLRQISLLPREEDFAWRAQEFARDRLGFALPEWRLQNAWITGLDVSGLYAYCVFNTFLQSVAASKEDQAPWRERMPIDEAFLSACGYHTIDISPCADGRLQGLLPFVLRMAPNPNVFVKAYAGALFDIENDLADWSMRELDRLSGGMPGREDFAYLKIAVYHVSSSHPGSQGCAAHGSNDVAAIDAALSRLRELQAAIENTYGLGAAPDVLLIGVDTDTDAIRIHPPAADGSLSAARFLDSAALYRETLGLSAEEARRRIDAAVAAYGEMPAGLAALVAQMIEANFSQIEYVIHHHAGRYAVIGHDEIFICAGEDVTELQLRNMYYYAHLDTLEEGAADMDVGVKIFSGLNLERGLAIPVLVHFRYDGRVPGSRARAEARCRRVAQAIAARYPQLATNRRIQCAMAVSDRCGGAPQMLPEAPSDERH